MKNGLYLYCFILLLSNFLSVTAYGQESLKDSLYENLNKAKNEGKIEEFIALTHSFAIVNPTEAIAICTELLEDKNVQLSKKNEFEIIKCLAKSNFELQEFKKSEELYLRASQIAGALGLEDELLQCRIGFSATLIETGRLTEAEDNLNNLLNLLRKYNFSVLKAEANFYLGNCYQKKDNFIAALNSYEIALQLSISQNENDLAANIKMQMGNLQQRTGKYKDAIEHYLEAEKFAGKTKNPRLAARIGLNMAALNIETKDYNTGIIHAIRALQLYKQLEMENGQADSYLVLSRLISSKKSYKEAIAYLDRAKVIFLKNESILGNAELNLEYGKLYVHRKTFDKATEALQKSLSLFRQLKIESKVAVTQSYLGLSMLGMGKNDSAEILFNQALKTARELNLQQLMGTIYKNKAQFYSETGKYYEAYYYLNLFSEIDSEMHLQIIDRQFADLYGQYKIEQSVKEIALLKSEQALKDAEIERGRIYIVFSLISTIILLSLIVLVIIILRNRKKLSKQHQFISDAYDRLFESENKALITELESSNFQLSQSQIELQDINNSRNKFFSIIAHDLRSPFNALLGYSELLVLQRENFSEEDFNLAIKHIYDSSLRLNSLVQNLLVWAMSEIGKLGLDFKNCNLSELVNESIAMLRISAETKQIALQTDIDSTIFVHIDRNTIATVLRNLISNAIKFTPENGTINISCVQASKMVFVSIVDSGIGMNTETMDTVFSGNKSQHLGTSGEKGTGLGLILCKEFVERNGGLISVRSEIGKGSTFTFSILNEQGDEMQPLQSIDNELQE